MVARLSREAVTPEAADAHRAQIRRAVAFGEDPISFFCSVLSDATASEKERREAALELLPYYHPRLARMGPLLERFGK